MRHNSFQRQKTLCWIGGQPRDGIPVNTHVHVGVDGHDEDDDVEGVQEPEVDHLEVGGLGHHLADAGLHRGNHQHARDGHHDAVLGHRKIFLDKFHFSGVLFKKCINFI